MLWLWYFALLGCFSVRDCLVDCLLGSFGVCGDFGYGLPRFVLVVLVLNCQLRSGLCLVCVVAGSS